MSDRLISDIESAVRRSPSAIAVAQLIETHGYEAAQDRWGWISIRTLISLNRQGIKQLERRAADGS